MTKRRNLCFFWQNYSIVQTDWNFCTIRYWFQIICRFVIALVFLSLWRISKTWYLTSYLISPLLSLLLLLSSSRKIYKTLTSHLSLCWYWSFSFSGRLLSSVQLTFYVQHNDYAKTFFFIYKYFFSHFLCHGIEAQNSNTWMGNLLGSFVLMILIKKRNIVSYQLVWFWMLNTVFVIKFNHWTLKITMLLITSL